MSINILMPALSPTMTEGKLAKWHVKEGDTAEFAQHSPEPDPSELWTDVLVGA